ncbi:coproporphyrinogen III oxidase [Sesbania bispinosa]|nr:coproporphyrinogen III oxidase [Sesbania bispinosa]
MRNGGSIDLLLNRSTSHLPLEALIRNGRSTPGSELARRLAQLGTPERLARRRNEHRRGNEQTGIAPLAVNRCERQIGESCRSGRQIGGGWTA